ncbi:MAG: hypothetical protein GF399_01200 [Candidatus Coatesbacteria bacterium]|nr:hypothetical protein [Candidatus Coatesbacteria bacterium]
MDSVRIVVDPEYLLRHLGDVENPLGELRGRAPGLALEFLRDRELEEHLQSLEPPPAVLDYYRKKTSLWRYAGEDEAPPAGEELEQLKLVELLIYLAEVAQAPFVLTDNQELVYQPYDGGRFYDPWELEEKLAEMAAELDDGPPEDWHQHRLGRAMATDEVHRAANEMQARLLTGLLKQNNIPYYIISNYVPWFDGIFTTAKGYWGTIHVLRGDAERARELIQDYIAARPDWDEIDEMTD